MARTKRPTATSTKPAQTSRSKTQQKKPPSVPKKPAKPKAKPKAKPSKFSDHKALFFWDESSKTSGFLAPWYEQPFKVDGTVYQSAGHYIMAEKARVFKDKKTLAALLASKSSAEHKALGNRVKGFQHAIWTERNPSSPPSQSSPNTPTRRLHRRHPRQRAQVPARPARRRTPQEAPALREARARLRLADGPLFWNWAV